MRSGYLISGFMKRIGRADRVIVVLSAARRLSRVCVFRRVISPGVTTEAEKRLSGWCLNSKRVDCDRTSFAGVTVWR
jgi:hypothetical protein